MSVSLPLQCGPAYMLGMNFCRDLAVRLLPCIAGSSPSVNVSLVALYKLWLYVRVFFSRLCN